MSHHELPLSLDAYELACLKRAIDQASGNLQAAAKLLGIGRSTMYRRLQRLTGQTVSQHKRSGVLDEQAWTFDRSIPDGLVVTNPPSSSEGPLNPNPTC